MPVVLIVDDHAALASGVAALLRSAGHTTHCRESGPAALTYLSEHAVDLLVLDLSMPGMSGLDVLRALQARSDNPSTPPPPVIIFSSKDEYREEALALGARDFVSKSSPLDLLGVVATHLPTDER